MYKIDITKWYSSGHHNIKFKDQTSGFTARFENVVRKGEDVFIGDYVIIKLEDLT